MNIFDDSSGIEQLRAMMAAGEGPGISRSLHFVLTEVTEGRVQFDSTPGPYANNPIGTIHGGYAATLLDSACGCAVHTRLSKGQGYTTLELKVNLTRPITREAGVLRCESRIVHVGGRTATSEGRIVDANGKLYAHGTTTCIIVDAPRGTLEP